MNEDKSPRGGVEIFPLLIINCNKSGDVTQGKTSEYILRKKETERSKRDLNTHFCVLEEEKLPHLSYVS